MLVMATLAGSPPAPRSWQRGAITVPMPAEGLDHLSVVDRVAGRGGALAGYVAVVLITGEVSLAQLRLVATRLRVASSPE